MQQRAALHVFSDTIEDPELLIGRLLPFDVLCVTRERTPLPPLMSGRSRLDTGSVIAVTHPDLGERFIYGEGIAALLFTENETNNERLFSAPNRTPYVKDGINNYVVHGEKGVVNPQQQGSKVAPHFRLTVNPGRSQLIRLQRRFNARGYDFKDRTDTVRAPVTVVPQKLPSAP